MARIDTTDFDDQRLASELRAMERSYDGVVQQFRLEDLRHRLDDGSVLKLHLFWPIRRGIATLRRVGWTSQIGWVIDVRTTDGDDHRLYAWKARLMRPAC